MNRSLPFLAGLAGTLALLLALLSGADAPSVEPLNLNPVPVERLAGTFVQGVDAGDINVPGLSKGECAHAGGMWNRGLCLDVDY